MAHPFDINTAAAPDSGIFGLPFSVEESQIVLLPVPWDATVSYGAGTAMAPEAIFKASKYIEFYDTDFKDAYHAGLAMAEIPSSLQKWNKMTRKLTMPIIQKGGALKNDDSTRGQIKKIDALCEKMNEYVYGETKKYLQQGKTVGLIGGDHSTPLGSIRAHLEQYPAMGILQIDAHCDLRKQFEGFTYSHASFMYNVMAITDVQKIVQIGVRGFCEEEFNRIRESNGRIVTVFNRDIAESQAANEPWNTVCERIVAELPKEVYLTLDVDGLDRSLCPNTGTPMPGGLSYSQMIILLKRIVQSGKKIVGFDLVEVCPGATGTWDADVGSELLYQMAGWSLKSRES